MKRIIVEEPRVHMFCGIDQGLSGAIALLSGSSLTVHDMPTITVPSGKKSPKTGKMGKKRLLDFSSIRDILESTKPKFTVSEKPVIARTGKEGKTSIATTHMNVGIILGMLFMGNLSYTEMRPNEWQKMFFKGRKGNTKTLSYDCACKLFPVHASKFRGPQGAIKDGRTDAALMAEAARRLYYGRT